VVVSDSHGKHNQLVIPECDVLIHCGDFTTRSTITEMKDFGDWIQVQPALHKLVVAGNHDWICFSEQIGLAKEILGYKTILMSSTLVEVDNLTIYGTFDEDHLYQNIPYGADILVTHYPPRGILDEVPPNTKFNKTETPRYLGNEYLYHEVQRAMPKYHFFGHIHEQGGRTHIANSTTYRNCALLDENYDLVRQPFVIDL
jgi:Icc-related predicted phosphoesterase